MEQGNKGLVISDLEEEVERLKNLETKIREVRQDLEGYVRRLRYQKTIDEVIPG